MLDLKWFEADPVDSDGERFHCHYLVDTLSDRCYATVAEPRAGHTLYGTDIKINDVGDRSYVTLEAAKAYCEFAAYTQDKTDSGEVTKLVDAVEEKEEPAPRPTSAWWYDE